jgi:hypothetical protein
VDIPVYPRPGWRGQDVDIRGYQPRALSAPGPSESAAAQRGVGSGDMMYSVILRDKVLSLP